jgi:hypothetical protein
MTYINEIIQYIPRLFLIFLEGSSDSVVESLQLVDRYTHCFDFLLEYFQIAL